MKVLIDSTLAQTLSFIPRLYPSLIDYTLIEEGTNKTTNVVAVSTIEVEGFLTISQIFTFTENKFYSIDIFDNSDSTLIFRDKIFVTNQDVKEYSINDGDYVEDESYDNDYIIIGEQIIETSPVLEIV